MTTIVTNKAFHISQRLRASAKDGTELTQQELLLAAEFIEAAYTVSFHDKNEVKLDSGERMDYEPDEVNYDDEEGKDDE